MPTPDDDLTPDVPAAERAELIALSERLAAAPPAPAGMFRGDLGRAIGAELRRRRIRARPQRLWLIVGGLTLAGAALLAAAAAQI